MFAFLEGFFLCSKYDVNRFVFNGFQSRQELSSENVTHLLRLKEM